MGTMHSDATYSLLLHQQPPQEKKRAASKKFNASRWDFWRQTLLHYMTRKNVLSAALFAELQRIHAERLDCMIGKGLTRRTIRKHYLDDPFLGAPAWLRKMDPRLKCRWYNRNKFKKGHRYLYNPWTKEKYL